jgi:hypothetical protein
MIEKNQTIFMDRALNPIIQAIVVLCILSTAMVVLFVLKTTGTMDVDNRAFWVIGGASTLFFGLFNSIISLGASDMNVYWFRSTSSYTVLMVASGCLAFLFSGLKMEEAGSFKFIYMVLTFGYLLFLSIMRFMRKIVQLAQIEDEKWVDRAKKTKR